jgi:hypothetical protein
MTGRSTMPPRASEAMRRAAALRRAPSPEGCRARVARLALLTSVLAGVGCASSVDVRSVATADPMSGAYELRGQSLAQLQVEARRLCPQGAEVLRQWQRYQQAASTDSPSWQWFGSVPAWFGDTEQGAQLMVACKG